jgi:hypothetical protein
MWPQGADVTVTQVNDATRNIQFHASTMSFVLLHVVCMYVYILRQMSTDPSVPGHAVSLVVRKKLLSIQHLPFGMYFESPFT